MLQLIQMSQRHSRVYLQNTANSQMLKLHCRSRQGSCEDLMKRLGYAMGEASDPLCAARAQHLLGRRNLQEGQGGDYVGHDEKIVAVIALGYGRTTGANRESKKPEDILDGKSS